jgi:hypothetical protein
VPQRSVERGNVARLDRRTPVEQIHQDPLSTTKEVRDRSMSPLNESDGPALVTTMIDPPDGSCRARQTRIRAVMAHQYR